VAPVQVVEKSPDIRIDYPVDVPRPARLTPLVQRLMLTVSLPEAMGKDMTIMRDAGLSDHHYRPLDNLGLEAGFPYWPSLPVFLLDPHPLERRRHVPIGAPPLVQGPQVRVQGLSVLLCRDLLQAWGTALLGLARGCPQARSINQVTHLVEHHLRRALGLLGNALALHGDGWCARSLSQRSCQHNVMPGVAFPPVGPVGRGSPPSLVLCAAKTTPCPSRVSSLAVRFPIPRLLHGVRGLPSGSWPGRSPQVTPGPVVARSPRPGMRLGDRGFSQVPAFPL
jgi:hypothetical protein